MSSGQGHAQESDGQRTFGDPVIVSDEEELVLEALRFPSADSASTVSWRLWIPKGLPRGTIQLVHGMAEHIGRYDALARIFAGLGYVVAGHDHIGHGETAASPEDLGHIPIDGGASDLIEDTHALSLYLSRRWPLLPHVVYGHSMGSFIARLLIAEYGEEFDAIVLSGTANVPAALSSLGLAVARGLALVRGERAHSNLVNTLALGSYNAAFKRPRTDFDWISSDESVVDAYVADERSGYQFTLGGYTALLGLAHDMVSKQVAANVPHDLPILLIAGEEDPVGDRGKGVLAAASLYREAGVERVDVKLYPAMRHEVHNEIGKERVMADVAAWLDEVLVPYAGHRFADPEA